MTTDRRRRPHGAGQKVSGYTHHRTKSVSPLMENDRLHPEVKGRRFHTHAVVSDFSLSGGYIRGNTGSMNGLVPSGLPGAECSSADLRDLHLGMHRSHCRENRLPGAGSCCSCGVDWKAETEYAYSLHGSGVCMIYQLTQIFAGD